MVPPTVGMSLPRQSGKLASNPGEAEARGWVPASSTLTSHLSSGIGGDPVHEPCSQRNANRASDSGVTTSMSEDAAVLSLVARAPGLKTPGAKGR